VTSPPPSEPIRVFLLDDHEIVRRGVKESGRPTTHRRPASEVVTALR